MSDSDSPAPQTTLEGDWYELEFLGTDGRRYVNVRLDVPPRLQASVTLRREFGEVGSRDYYRTETVCDTSPGDDGDIDFEYLLGGEEPADAETFRELADAATRAAEYLEADADDSS